MAVYFSQFSIYNVSHPWTLTLRPPIFFFLKQLYWHSTSVTIASFLRGHVNLMILTSAVDTLWLFKITPQIQFSERSPLGTPPQVLVTTLLRVHIVLLILIYPVKEMDYNHKVWTVGTLIRDDSVGHFSSGNVITTWSRFSEIFSYI